MTNIIKKLLVITLLTIQVATQVAPAVYADEVVDQGSTTTEQTTPGEQTQEASQTTEPTPTQEQATPTPTPTPYVEDETDKAARLYREQLQKEIQDQVDAYLISQGITPPERNRVSPTPTPTNLSQTSDSTPDGVGDIEIDTGDAASTTSVVNSGNNNLAGVGAGSGGSGAVVANTANGTGSTNSGSAVVDNNNNTTQTNSASVNTNLNSSTVTGDNTASDNVGDASIKTGDANSTGTVITMVNTNAEGVMVSEFNVLDDQIGDVVLDFAANCIVGCGGTTNVANTANGSNSTNQGSVDTTNTTTTTQENDAQIGNDLVLSADTGNNTASRNTGGDSSITTGDANVAANIVTFANNNIAGNVIYGIVNIFFYFIGDIIFPEDQLNACCGGNVAATNTGNGSNSTNTSDIDIVDTDNTFQSNTADITNDLVFDANTGDNTASRNTGGDSSISTGDTTIDVNLLNIANNNIVGGNWWIVLVNDVTKGWIGKIMGAPDDAFFAGSEGSDFEVDENGYVTAKNNKNGTNSTNDTAVSTTNTNTTNQTNNADINNTLNLSANTGNNATSDNTGGNSNIKTGDATIVANMINFVNNNIKGNGKVFVTVVNVFGTWLGDFVSPGQKKEEKTALDTHTESAASNTTDSHDDDNGSNKSSNQSSNTKSTGSSTKSNSNGTTEVTSGGSHASAGSVGSGSTEDENSSLVKGASLDTSVLGADTAKGAMSINLAWLLLVLPIVGIIIVKRKKLLARKLV
ncbi:MAG: hypothetical protein HZC02_00590 [Candidatus Levybacteria bacterium]|nr:hypothetical protein [Candidatus Levybacteria bacterium]